LGVFLKKFTSILLALVLAVGILGAVPFSAGAAVVAQNKLFSVEPTGYAIQDSIISGKKISYSEYSVLNEYGEHNFLEALWTLPH
jgi:hypothetical protein